jgi:plastocyanin
MSHMQERREWVAFGSLLALGVLLMLLAGQAAIRIVPDWQVAAVMDSNIDPDAEYAAADPSGRVEPVRQEILTPPAWADSLLTPQAASGGGPSILPVFPADSLVTVTPQPATPTATHTRTPLPSATPTRTPLPAASATPTSPPPSGTIVLRVDALPDDAQNFTYNGSLGTFLLDDDADATLASTLVLSGRGVGSYTLTQDLPSGWVLSGIACSDPDGGSLTDPGTRTATIDLDAGETVTCTFTNARRGTITIAQDNTPDDPQTFDFSGDLGSLTLGESSTSISDLVPGSYSVTESALAGWALSGLSCSDPDGGSTASIGTRTATIDLDPGETVSCTFTNTDRGTIVIVETKAVSVSQAFSFSGSLGSFPLDASSTTFASQAAGSYTVTEGSVSGWSLTGLSCSDPDGGSSTNTGARTATIDLDAGETITCTFTNNLTINIGAGDGYWTTIGDGGSLTLPLASPISAHGDTGWDFVYYERAAGSGINMDFVIIQLSPDSGATWYTVFDYGGSFYANSNIAAYPQADNQDIPASALIGSTGVGIDLYALTSASLIPDVPYNTIRILSPIGGAGDGCDVDAIQIIP